MRQLLHTRSRATRRTIEVEMKFLVKDESWLSCLTVSIEVVRRTVTEGKSGRSAGKVRPSCLHPS